MTDKHLDLIKDAKTGKAIVKALKDDFERRSVVKKLMQKRRFFSLKLHKTEELENNFLSLTLL